LRVLLLNQWFDPEPAVLLLMAVDKVRF